MTDDEWLKGVRDKRAAGKCPACKFPRLFELVSVIRGKKVKVPVSLVYERMLELDPKFGARVSCEGLRRHFASGHDPCWRPK